MPDDLPISGLPIMAQADLAPDDLDHIVDRSDLAYSPLGTDKQISVLGRLYGTATLPAVPAAPQGLAAYPGDGTVSLQWEATADSYMVYRGTSRYGALAAVAVGLTSPAYADSGLVNGTTYFYAIAATNAAGTSLQSKRTDATPAAAVAGHTLLVREEFRDLATRNAAAPGDLGTVVAGEWPSRAGGPRYPGPKGHGWSAALPLSTAADGTVLNDCHWLLSDYGCSNYLAHPRWMMGGWFIFFGAGGSGAGVGNDEEIISIYTLVPGAAQQWRVESNPADPATVLLRAAGYVVGGLSAPVAVPKYTPIWLSIGVDNAGQFTPADYRWYKMVLGADAAPVLVQSAHSNQDTTSLNMARMFRRISYNRTGWFGRVGAWCLYALNALSDAATLPTDFARPSLFPPDFWVVPGAGDDTKTGVGRANAWATGDKLRAEADGCGVIGVAEPWGPYGIDTVPTADGKVAWATAYDIGTRPFWGPAVVLDTTIAPLTILGRLSLGGLGVSLESATADYARLTPNRPLIRSWARPNATAYPHAWGTLESTDGGFLYTGGMGAAVYETTPAGLAQLKPIVAANLAAALPLLEAAAVTGAFYVDPATALLYVRSCAASGGGNPNTDGVAREYGQDHLGADGTLVDVGGGGRAVRIWLDGGLTMDPLTGVVRTQALGANDTTGVNVLDACKASHPGKHGLWSVGGAQTGLMVYRDCLATLQPGGIDTGLFTPYVDFNSGPGNGSAVVVHLRSKTADDIAALGVAGADPTKANDYGAYLSHNLTGSGQYARLVLTDCDFGGNASVGVTALDVAVTGGTFRGGLDSFNVGNLTVTGAAVRHHLPWFVVGGTATMSDTNVGFISPTYTGPIASLQGVVRLTNVSVDVTGGSVYAGAWRRTAAVDFQWTGGTHHAQDNLFGLLVALMATDTLVVTNVPIQGQPTWRLVQNYNNGGTDKTYADGQAAGWLVNCPISP